MPPGYGKSHYSLTGQVLRVTSSRSLYCYRVGLRDLGFSPPPVRSELLSDIRQLLPFHSI